MAQNTFTRRAVSLIFGIALLLVLPAIVYAQRGPAQGAPPPGRRGGGPPAPVSPQQAAPIDLTGYWVSIVSEDWRWRMITPPRGDYASIPLNAAGRQVADAWDMAQDVRDGNQCRPFGVAGLLRIPGRLHITWEGVDTIRLETDAGTQTRLLYLGDMPPVGEQTWQGRSVAAWEVPAAGRGRGPAAHGSLKVTTTMMKSGYLRWNGVPFSEDAVVTEYFDRHGAFGQEWITVATRVDDRKYLNQPFVTTTHFRREPDGTKWSPTPCETAPPPVEKVG